MSLPHGHLLLKGVGVTGERSDDCEHLRTGSKSVSYTDKTPHRVHNMYRIMQDLPVQYHPDDVP